MQAETPSQDDYVFIEDKNSLRILTPSLAERVTAKVRLTNGLEAYIISDPAAEASSAALAIHVGSWSDPEEFPGMAHFLEHMLFMGTQTYPDEKAFAQYISDHGGLTNAYTSLDRTVYTFSINNDAFAQGLDLFSHFFIDPLFKASGVGRELHAVDQEHAKNIQNDSRRKWMIFKETGNPHHPNKAFATGNALTLGHIPREALVEWYNKNYSSSLMHLVLYSPLPLDTLIDLAIQDFTPIPERKNTPLPSYAPLSSEMQKGHITYITPVKDLKILSLDWELPKRDDQETKSAELIAYLLENGSDSSLIEELKREKLAESLSVSADTLSTDHQFLHINIALTQEGVSQFSTVIERCFQTIALLKKGRVPAYLFEEMQTMATLNYEYQSRSKPFELVTKAADELIDEPLATYPQNTLLSSRYDPSSIRAILDSMTPKNCIITLLASPELTGVTPDKKEKWNGGLYTVVPVEDKELKKWLVATPHPKIHIPTPNPYIPKDLHLVHTKQVSHEIPSPLLLQQDAHGKSYLWEDVRYQTPEICYLLGIKTPLLDGSAKSAASTDLFIKTFYQKSSPTLSLANAAGLSASVDHKNFRLLISVSGYSEKAPYLLKHLLTTIKNLSCTKEEFALYKASLLSLYDNQQKAQPYIQAGEFLSHALYNDAPLSSRKAEALKALTYEEWVSFAKGLFTQCAIENLYAGNLSEKQGLQLTQDMISTLAMSSYPAYEQRERELLILPKKEGPYAITEKLSVLGNAALLAIEQGPFSFEKKASQMILSTLLSESFYTTLRSQQQTGYIAASWPREVQQNLLQFFLVQSSTHDPQDLLTRFELFLEGYVKDFSAQLPIDRFQEIKESSITTLSQIPPNLSEMSSYLYDLAFDKKGNFTFTEELISALKNLSYETLKRDTLQFFSRKNTQRLALLAQGETPENFLYKTITIDALRKQGSFISSEP